MNRNKNCATVSKERDDKKKRRGGKPKNGNRRDNRERGKEREVDRDPKLNPEGRDNDPNWYFTDATLADQVSQLSFQNLAGYPISVFGHVFDIPNINVINLNPCPGVIKSSDYGNPLLNKASGINLSGFRLFSKISAYTGRVAAYGPQDISTMVLAMGEIISCMEWCRRAFGIANASSMRNRSYPREFLSWALRIDDDDFFKNYANYRTRFNGLVTMVNQLPIPKGIPYFEKCAALYERVYLDQDSSMAQSIVLNPYSTWILDETSDPRGSVLATTQWTCNANFFGTRTTTNFSDYLDIVDLMIGALLNSSTLQVVYTDLLNLATKVGQEFWKLDYLVDGYLVLPEYNENFMLQMHNASLVGWPKEATELTSPHVTRYNDVVPNANTNSLYYNPGFTSLGSVANGIPRTGPGVLIDMLSDHPSVEDRVECTRFSAVAGQTHYGSPAKDLCDAVLPDHYAVSFSSRIAGDAILQSYLQDVNASILPINEYGAVISVLSNIDWAPQMYQSNSTFTDYEGLRFGDLNFYTYIDSDYLWKLHQFMTLGLYDLRAK